MTEKDTFRVSLLINSEHNKRCNTITDKFSNDEQYIILCAKYKFKTIIFMIMSQIEYKINKSNIQFE